MNASRKRTGFRPSAWLLAVILFLGSAYFYQDPEWNGNSRLNLTRAIIERGTLTIDAYHEAPGWETGDKAIVGGHYYSDKAIGASLLALPLYFVLFHLGQVLHAVPSTQLIKHVLTTGVMGTLFAVAGVAMYFIAFKIARRLWSAAIATLALAFGSMLWPYSAVFYGHVPAAAFLILTFALLFAASQSPTGGTPWTWFATGLCVSMAFLGDHTSALVIVGLAVYGIYALRRLDFAGKLRTAWPALAGVLIPLMVFFAYNMAIYGRPVDFGYSHEVEDRFQDIMGLGVMGIRLPTPGASYHITLDPKFGLFWLSPVLVLAPVGYWLAFRRTSFRGESLVSMYAILIMFLMNAASYLWYGGSAFGPRLMISALPFFIVPLALLPTSWRWVLVGLGLISAANMLIPLLGQIQYTRLEFKPDRGGFFVAGAPFHGFSLLYGYGLPEIRRLAQAGQSPWTLGSAVGLPLGLSVVLLAGAESALIALLHRLAATDEA